MFTKLQRKISGVYTKVKLDMNNGKKGNSIKVMKDDDDGEWKHVAYVREPSYTTREFYYTYGPSGYTF